MMHKPRPPSEILSFDRPKALGVLLARKRESGVEPDLRYPTPAKWWALHRSRTRREDTR